MTTFSAPKLTTIEGKAFYNCDDLLDLSIATDTGVVLQSIDVHAFHSANITATVLTIGISNSDYIFYGDTLIIGDVSIEFDDIIITGNLLELAA